jgi:hypothetical protein
MRTPLAVLVSAVLLLGSASTADATSDPVPSPEAPVTTPVADSATAGDLAPVVPVPDDALSDALADGDITTARYTLERARSLFTPEQVERHYGAVAEPDPRDATLILRDLALRAGRLAPDARADAERLLARPTSGRADPFGTGYRTKNRDNLCSAHLCFHWVRDTRDAPVLEDSDGDAVPDWVETTAATFEHVWRVEIDDDGYRTPRSDRSSADNGGDGRLDVYLADLGSDGIYGYCTSDDPARRRRDVSSYCVVDDDFSRTQFRASPQDSLRVTAAHEFFHAVQFAYDVAEDVWLMEGTAAWVEDEVYDRINDNHQYLRRGPLTHPQLPLDSGVYQPWVFFRFMTEHLGTAKASAPDVVRQIWRRADASRGARNEYSLQAVSRVAAGHGTPFRRLFADFGRAAAFPARAYEEGRSYPRAPMTRSFTLTGSRPATGEQHVVVHHLANPDIAVRPGSGTPARRRLRVEVDLPDRVRGSEATVTVARRSGAVRAYRVALGRSGNGSVRVPFDRASVSRVVITLTNASTRMRCHRATRLSCAGMPRDDFLRFAYSARAVR